MYSVLCCYLYPCTPFFVPEMLNISVSTKKDTKKFA
jgi:hypothetical protein